MTIYLIHRRLWRRSPFPKGEGFWRVQKPNSLPLWGRWHLRSK